MARVSEVRGREARLRPACGSLYPGLEADRWLPVETVLRHVATLLLEGRITAQAISGERVLREEHFEFRGDSPRPALRPPGRTRIGDAAAERPAGQEDRGRG